MVTIQYAHILIAVFAVVVASILYYIVLNKRYKQLLGEKPLANGSYKISVTPNRLVVEIARNYVLGLVIAYAIIFLGITELNQAIILSLWLWVGFPLVILTGQVAHENYSKALAAIHAGDWLIKLIIFCVILTLLR